jgi:Flp pilus assembly protein TadG
VASVELVLLMPLLLLLVFGLIEYGWMFMKASEVSNAARCGARHAILPSVTNATQVTGADSPAGRLLTKASIPVHDDTITVTDVDPGMGELVTVGVTVPYSDVELLRMKFFIPRPSHLRASVSMAKEGPG